jgi:hypothetical protein
MRKMILLAAMVAIAALMLAATPALAQQGNLPSFREVDGFLIKPGDCGIGEQRFGGEQLTREETLALEGVDEGNLPGGVGTPKFCVIELDNNNPNNPNDNNNRDNNNRDNNNRDNNRNNNNNNNIVPVFEVTQDLEQEAESGDVDQSFDVSQTGDNSNQTVGIQGVANTGNAQNQIGVIDADGFGNFDGNDFNRNDFNRDDFCDFDGNRFCDNDNNDDLCDVFGGDFCDHNNNDDLCDVFGGDFCDNDNNDRVVFVNDDNDDGFFRNNDGDVEIEDSGASIDVSPTNTVNGGSQQVNQAAAASAPQWVWTARGWMLV